MRGFAALIGFMTLWASAPVAATVGPPSLKGQCKWVHGRFSVANGSSVQRIWIIGTKHIVALWDSDENLPPAVLNYELSGPHDEPLFGDFRICALENLKPGHMQHVTLRAAKNLRFQSLPYRFSQIKRQSLQIR